MGITPTGRDDVGGGHTGDGDLHLPPPEHGHTIHCDHAHYGTVSGGRATPGYKGGKAVVKSGVSGTGGVAAGFSGIGTGTGR